MSKLGEFSNFILKYDIICLQETWLRNKDITAFHNFMVLRSGRESSIGEGTTIICRPDLDPSVAQLQFLEEESFEYTAIIANKLLVLSKRVMIISIYRPPSLLIGNKRWNRIFNRLEQVVKNYVLFIYGDLNSTLLVGDYLVRIQRN